jgi:hypothetical protein
MSALTINKVVCRVYGTLFLLLGVTSLLFGGLLIYRGAAIEASR